MLTIFFGALINIDAYLFIWFYKMLINSSEKYKKYLNN